MKSIYANRKIATAMGGLLIAATLILGGPSPQIPGEYGGADGYLTHITTDKPIYRSGEKLYVRGVVLRANGHSPMASTQTSSFEIKGPKGETVASGTTMLIDSTIGFSWDIPSSQAGGEYTVRISNPLGAPAERKFDIRTYRAPRLKSQIVFVRDGYGPGDTAAASLHVERAEGGIPAGARVSVTARIDGEETWRGATTVDSSGNASASFTLPAAIARGEGVIAMTIQDGGTVETATKTIPILLQTLDLAFYPEGGDLIAGLPNRVYFEGKTPTQKPADTAGFILNAAGKEVAAFRSEHEGRGRFTFVPVKGETYFFHVTEPAGIRTVFPLPVVKENGLVLSSTSDLTPRKKDVVLRIAATADGTYDVALTQHGKEFAFKSVSLKANQSDDVTFTLPRSLDGVMVATVYDDNKTPLAERLIFRQPERQLNVKVVADRSDYVPGDKVTLKVVTTEDNGKPVGAVVGLTVTDSSVLEMIDKREQAPQLPVMVLFENEVRNLSDAHVYLDESNPKAPLATDLLLGTQGWRRFATVDPVKFMSSYNDAARRVLGIRMLAGTAAGFGSLSGSVVDPTNALIPGVAVMATNTATGVTTTVLTNDSGSYNFETLPAGPYMLTSALLGLQPSRITNITLGPAERRRFNLVMTVVAQGAAMDIDARTILAASGATIGAPLTAAQVHDLPMVGNNVLNLINVLPGFNGTTFTGISANMVNTVRDGLAVADPRFQNGVFATTLINPDLVGEVRLILTPVDAELGRGNAQIGPGGARLKGAAQVGRPTPIQAPVIVREYAHPLRPNWNEGSREDFAETVYWNAGVRTDASTGTATVSFNLSDSVTSFRVLADAFDQNGALGSGINHVESVQPFSIEPKMPLQITSGDVIQLPIGIVNGMNRELHNAVVSASGADGLNFTMLGDNTSTLGPKERTRRLLQIDVARGFSGMASLLLDARAGSYHDSVSRKLDVQPLGFPYELATGGVLDRNASKSFEFTLPAEIVRGSVSSIVTVYPTPLASMTDALQSLLREPYGCFEQTSSTSYPMVMAQQYFLTHSGVEPAIIEKTRNLLDISYKKLTGFESRTKGYEWFGGDPGHEALTAYGLMQFTDMAQVRSVDKDMLARTRAWLLARRDGNGSFNLNSRALDSFGRAPAETTNAYIVWSLIETGEKGLEREIASVKASAASTQDSYIVALGANILGATGDIAGARQLMDKLAKFQDASGKINGAVTSITRSGGDALNIETTALSVLAWMRDPEYAAQVEKGLKWIVESNKSGRFGSTQSTILALRSIVAYDNAHARTKAPGRIVVTIDGQVAGAPLAFTANTQDALVLPQLASALGAGKHALALKMEDGSSMPFSISVKFHSTLPDSSEHAQIGIQVALQDRKVQEGGVTEAVVSVTNKSDQAIPTPVAIIGIPGGLEVRHDQLKELVKSGRIDAYEVIGREVVLYWRYLKANDKFDLPLSLVAAVPGSYTGPASRAYLYYTDEYKSWAPGLQVNITPR